MTIKEFSRKHDIPYSIAHRASLKVHPVSSMAREKDYCEEDLLREVALLAKRRIKDCKKYIERYIDVWKKAKGIQE